MKRLLLIGLTVLVCGVCTSQAANMPQYQFYSTSMLSPNKQSNYAPSHINQSGSVKVQLNANRRVPLYQMGVKSGNLRVFSAEAFTKPVSGNDGIVIVGSYVAANANANAKNGSSLNSSFSNGLYGLKLYTLATASQSSANANANANAERQSAKIQRRTWLNIDEVERLEELENLALDSLRTLRTITLLETMSTVQGILADESLVTADRRRAPGTPGSEGEQLPVGDAVLPLLLFALAYVVWKRRKTKMHMALMALVVMTLSGCGTKSPAPTTPRYSQAMINARMTAWYNKENCVGFRNENSTNGIVNPEEYATWDYVPGVVAKGILDVWQYYQDSAWADAWYIGLAEWAERFDDESLQLKGGILDDLNCAKVFMGLYEGAKPGGRFENPERAEFYLEQMRRTAKALAEHKKKYSIRLKVRSSVTRERAPIVNGGWMHKATDNPEKSYWGQMWCDGAYMGQALLAQLLLYGATEGTGLGWNDVVKQFSASWPYLWDEDKQLLYHVLFTDVTTNKNARAIYESGHAYLCDGEIMRHEQVRVYHSEESWSRAAGWYILALVDALEAYVANLDEGEYPGADFETIRGYLVKLADGLVARQDPETGCWYQLLQYNGRKCATQGEDDTGSKLYTNVEKGGTQCNYLESSGSCLITAALLKGTRLGFLDHAEAGKRGYEGILRQFVRGEGGEMTITSSCQSAGLSADRNGTAAYYLIGKDVPIQDNTEGKVLGAFLMAAVEYERLTR